MTFVEKPLVHAPPPALQQGGYSPFWELVRSRFLEFCREPEVVFWVYGFPVLMVVSLGIAYRERAVPMPRVEVVAGPASAADAAALARPESGVTATVSPHAAALESLRTGRADLVLERVEPVLEAAAPATATIRYHVDPSRPESVLARDRARDALERAAGRRDLLAVDGDFARVGAQKLWAGTVHIHPNAKTGAHHHGPLESVIYVLKGKARMRWGEALEFTAEAGPGDFIYIPPFVPHQEINASPDEVLECVLVRSDGESVVVNLDIEPVEKPENVAWIDPIHKS